MGDTSQPVTIGQCPLPCPAETDPVLHCGEVEKPWLGDPLMCILTLHVCALINVTRCLPHSPVGLLNLRALAWTLTHLESPVPSTDLE